MTTLSWLLLFFSGFLLWAARRLHRGEAVERYPARSPHATPPTRRPPPSSAAGPAPPPRVEPLEWITPPPPLTHPEQRRARLRDRYVAARFPGVLRGSEDLRAIEYVIKVARHCFEEGRLDDADELFELAIEQSPQERTLRLAQLEIAFLARDAAQFTRLARVLRDLAPDLPEWDQVARLGHALAPDDPLFAAPGGEFPDHYGPWPDMPNWIQASWDLTSEVLGAEFHRAMASRDDAEAAQTLRAAA